MPKLVFDPEGEFDTCSLQKRNTLYGGGGGLTGAKRCEYVVLCKQMTSRDPALDYSAIRDRILAMMKENVLEHIQTLPEADRASLVADIESFFSTIDKEDNPLTAINVVGFQISILFTNYIQSHTPNSNKIYGGDAEQIYTNIIQTEDWKQYSNAKEGIERYTEGGYCELTTNENPNVGIAQSTAIRMVFLGFLTLGELMESYINNVFYFGIVYTREVVDSLLYNPLGVLEHDYGHYLVLIVDCREHTLSFSKMKELYTYSMTTKEKTVHYPINFIYFLLLHENPCAIFTKLSFNLKNKPNNKVLMAINKDSISKYIKQKFIKELSDIQTFGLAIPKAYRIPKENNPKKLEQQKILEYIDLASTIFVECYKEFVASQQGGKRKRKTQKWRINRKQKYSRRKPSK
jgi:hypothetical protein